jgi:hypothetical protein
MDIIKTVANVNFTADEWGLYETQTSNMTATALNRAFEAAVNRSGSSRRTVENEMYLVQTAHMSDGACDSEIYHLLNRQLDRIFGD